MLRFIEFVAFPAGFCVGVVVALAVPAPDVGRFGVLAAFGLAGILVSQLARRARTAEANRSPWRDPRWKKVRFEVGHNYRMNPGLGWVRIHGDHPLLGDQGCNALNVAHLNRKGHAYDYRP